MQDSIIQKLDITPHQYEALQMSNYMEWCESVTINDREFQKVLANASVSKWYMIEYSKCEKEFQLLTKRYAGSSAVSTDDYKICYADCIDKMLSIRPTALLQEIKKTHAIGSMSVQGVKIPSLTFNQN
ncbi:hypothetical protein [Flavobacterium laiguense]|uniref:Uncharacterized protein n=1 Tax=Flavobacterium laiguense TaxID=2169409 RepID=A0A2U1K0A6_9FLAO|nr:hypothetical protein [Flavobacterium laiguense]PWA10940.1 hypothetical protein DB891_03675 [Flavobacterium laiguense]